MWFGAVLVSLVLCYTTSQPLEDTTEHGRSARQLELGNCCPCPDRSSRTSSDDDCPCRSRSADSEGAPSLLFPTALHPTRPKLKSADTQEDAKNLLNPEVDLATSMLETLRDVTDEEYQDAVARDAARAAKAVLEGSRDASDVESGRNLVTIIVSPKETENFDDVMPEASHVQEARCISPLGSYKSSSAKMEKSPSKQTNLLSDIFMFPKPRPLGLLHRDLMDRDSHTRASNVHERVVDALDDVHPRKGLGINNKSLLNLFHSNRDSSSLLSKPKSGNDCEDNVYVPSNLKTFTTNRSAFISPVNLQSSIKPQHLENVIESSRHLTNDDQDSDLSEAPSNIKEQFSEDGSETEQTIGLGALSKQAGNGLFHQKTTNRLKNLLKLKDVELIPPVNSNEKSILNLYNLRPIAKKPFGNRQPSLQNSPKDLNDLLRNGIKFNFNREKSVNCADSNEKLSIGPSDISVNSEKRNGNLVSDILPSASNYIKQLSTNNDNSKIDKESYSQSSLTDQIIDENFADATSSASENHFNILTSIPENADGAQHAVSNENGEINHDLEEHEFGKDVDFQKTIEVIQNKQTLSRQHGDERKDEQEEVNHLTENEENATKSNLKECPEFISKKIRAKLNNVNERMDNNILPTVDTGTTLVGDGEEIMSKDESEILVDSTTKNPSKISKALTTFRENVQETLANLKKPNTKTKPRKLFEVNIRKSGDEGTQDFLNDVSERPEMRQEPTATFATINHDDTLRDSNPVTIEDLQKLSDSLLHISSKNERETANTKENTKSNEQMYQLETDTVEEVNKSSEILNSNPGRLLSETGTESSADLDNVRSSNEEPEENTCLSDLSSSIKPNLDKIISTPRTNTNDDGITLSEMAAQATDPIMNVITQDPLNLFKNHDSLLADIIVQPSSLLNSESNLLTNPPVGILDIGLPTLDDLKSSLSMLNIFDASDREVGNERSGNDACNIDGESSPEMTSSASSPIFQSHKLPQLKHLEDVNLDIFKIRPLTRAESKLNSLSNKLSASKANPFDSKSKKWPSALGDKGGLLDIPVSSKRLERPILRSEKIAKPLNLASFDEMRESMRSNVQSLLNKDTIPPAEPFSVISDDIKYHAEDALRNAQKTIKSLKHRPLSDINVLGNSIKKPQDVIELASRAREDVGDKLKALHYDFNDRLTTMRENLFDQSRLGNFQLPLLSDHGSRFGKFAENKPNERNFAAMSNPLSDRRNSQRKQVTNEKLLLKNSENTFHTGKTKAHKMLTSPSVFVPKNVELPQLKSSKLEPKPIMPGFDEKAKQDLLKSFKNTNFLKKKSVEIKFSTTPSSTLSDTDDTENIEKVGPANSGFGRTRINPFRTNYAKDSNGSPSDLSLKEVPIPSSEIAAVDCDDLRLTTVPVSEAPKANMRTSPPLFRQILKSNSEPSKSHIKEITDRTEIGPKESIGTTRIDNLPSLENTFIKLRDAFRARLSKLHPILNPEENQSKSISSQIKTIPLSGDVDMTRSASENLETVIEEPLKENISYNCRMVCTKE